MEASHDDRAHETEGYREGRAALREWSDRASHFKRYCRSACFWFITLGVLAVIEMERHAHVVIVACFLFGSGGYFLCWHTAQHRFEIARERVALWRRELAEFEKSRDRFYQSTERAARWRQDHGEPERN